METSGNRAIEKNSLVKKVAQFDLETVLGFSREKETPGLRERKDLF